MVAFGRHSTAFLFCMLSAVAVESSAAVFQVVINGTAIVDGGAMDLSPLANSVGFNVVDATTGYRAIGTFERGSGGALIGLGTPVYNIRLTALTVSRPAGAAGGTLLIQFEDNFTPAQGAPLLMNAASGITGSLANANAVGGGTNVTFLGTVNGKDILGAAAPNNVRFSQTVGQNNAANEIAVQGARGTPTTGGPIQVARLNDWDLVGTLGVTLAKAGDRLVLPSSAEVVVASEILAVPEPQPMLLLAVGLGSIAGLAWWRNRRPDDC
jgi:hypothetical protein